MNQSNNENYIQLENILFLPINKTTINYSEFWSVQDELEVKEHTIFTLQHQLKSMEETNAELGEHLNQTMESLETLKILNNSIKKNKQINDVCLQV